MSEYILDQRRRALEESFFKQVDDALLQQLQTEMREKEEKESLAQATGITDDELLDRLIHHGISSSTWAALSLVPLVEVAWADGRVADREREAVLKAAHEKGVDNGSPSYALLEQWLRDRPDPQLRAAWKEYVHELVKKADPDAIAGLKATVMQRAQDVAEAAGGFLGMGRSVSDQEQAVLDELEAAFAKQAER